MTLPARTFVGADESTMRAMNPEYLHELGIYRSDEEFKQLICPFALGGLESREPVVFAYDAHKVGLLHEWLPEEAGISYVTDASPYASPAKALAAWRAVVEDHLSAGASRVRIAGNVPHPGYGHPYAGWDRYEAAVDHALADLPVWAPCLYDARIAPDHVLESAKRLHHHVLERDGTHHVNPSFDPPGRLEDFLAPPPDDLQTTRPMRELVDPTPCEARAAVAQALEGLDRHDVDALVLAASEAVANARRYGVPPVQVRIWRGQGRGVVEVHDRGSGPADPLAGLLSTGEVESGRGLWLAHHLDIEVSLAADDLGFAVRLRAGHRA